MAFQTELVQVFLVVGNGVPENTGFCHKNDILKVYDVEKAFNEERED